MLHCGILILLLKVISSVDGKTGGYLSPCWNSKNCAKGLVCRLAVDKEAKPDFRCRLRIKAGEKCWNSDTCAENHICSTLRTQFGKTKICHKPSAKNEFCWPSSHCAENLVCRAGNEELICLPKGKPGATCDTNKDCEKKLQCRRKFLADMRTICLDKGKVGEPCVYESHCEKGLKCRKRFLTDPQNTCLKKGKRGELCEYSEQCEKNLYCRVMDTKPDTPKRCYPKSTKGEFCLYDSNCESPYRCKGHRTLPQRYCSDTRTDIGDYCRDRYGDCNGSDGSTCRRVKPGVITTCQNYAKIGEFCEEDWHCGDTMQCKGADLGNGKCDYRSKAGSSCWENYECPPPLSCRTAGPSKDYYYSRYCLEPLANRKFCSRDSDCKSTVCLKRSQNKSSVCRDPLPLGSVFDYSKHCTKGLTCRKRHENSTKLHCLPKIAAGKACVGNDECEEKHSCRKGLCERSGSEYGQICGKSWECKGKLVCLNKKCQVCRANKDCPSDHFCKAFKCQRN